MPESAQHGEQCSITSPTITNTYVLSHSEREAVREAVASLQRCDPHRRLPEAAFLHHATAARRFPDPLLAFLERFRALPETHPEGFVLIRNLPLDAEIGPTPVSPLDPFLRETSLAENLLLAICTRLGDPFVHGLEQNGRMPGALIPQRGQEHLPINGSSTQPFGWHVDNVVNRVARPHRLALLCLRPDPDGEAATTTASLAEALPLLSPRALHTLERAWYTFTPPLSFGGQGEPVTLPVITPHLFNYRAYDRTAMNEEAGRALAELDEALNHVARSTRTAAGDCLILNNRAICHGRTSFRAEFDDPELAARNRYMLRVYITESLWTLRPWCEPGTRVLLPAAP